MNKIWNFLENNITKVIGIPLVLNAVEFLMMLMHSLEDGLISHDELEVLLKFGDGINLIILSSVMAYLKFKKK